MLKCRTCFADCDPQKLLNLYLDYSQSLENRVCIAEVLSDVAHIKVAKDDNLPDNICIWCYARLKDAQTFIEKTQETDKLLRDSLTTSNAEVTIIEESPTDVCLQPLIQENVKHGVSNALETSTILRNGCIDDFQNDDITEHLETAPNAEFVNCEDQSFGLIAEADIKLEPEIYEECNFNNSLENCDFGHDVPTADHIKVEPLSEDAALMYHQQTGLEEQPNLLNGYREEHYFTEDFKPSEEDLAKYATEVQQNCISKKPEISHDCNYCNRKLSSKHAKFRHEKKHKKCGEKCLLCNKAFKTMDKLKHHVMMFHSYGEPLECKVCDTSFPNLKALLCHSDTHLSIKPNIKCDRCPKAKFSSLRQLKKHLWTHKKSSDNKSSATEMCEICNRTFVNKAAIASHIRHFHGKVTTRLKDEKHSAKDDKREEPTEIPKKKKIISKPKNVKHLNNQHRKRFKHLRQLKKGLNCLPNVERKFECYICKNRFKRKDHLKRHQISLHNLEC